MSSFLPSSETLVATPDAEVRSRPGPNPDTLQAELARLRRGLLEPVPLAEFRRQQAEHDARCEALFQRHLLQMRAACIEAAQAGRWFERFFQAVLWRVAHTHIERVAWNRASLSLHHWGWLQHRRPGLSSPGRARLSARRALRRAPERARRALEQPLAEALLFVLGLSKGTART